MSGYVLIHRDLIGNPQFRGKDDEYAAIWLVVMAAWESTVVRAGRDRVSLKRGQCAYAVSYLAQAWECSKSAAYGRLKHFEAVGFITVQAGRDYTLITIPKYDEYQPGDAFGYRSGSVQAERDEERQQNAVKNAEDGGNAGVFEDQQTQEERKPVVQPERCPNDIRTNNNEGNEVNNISSLRSEIAGASGAVVVSGNRHDDSEDLRHAVNAYNVVAERCGLPSVQNFSDTRKRKLRQRLKDCGGLSGWVVALEKLEASSFCRGERNDFRADFDFLMQAQSFTRLMEGRYDDRKPSDGSRPGGGGQQRQNFVTQAFDELDFALTGRGVQ